MGFEQDNTYPMLDPTPELLSFAGGYKYSESLFGVDLTQSPDCKNVFWRDNALWQMDGNEKMAVDAITGEPEISGLFDYGQESTGTHYTLGATGDAVWAYSGGVWSDITDGHSLTAGAQHFGLTFNDNFWGVTSERDAPYKKDGAGNLEAWGGTPPHGKVLGRMGEFIIIGNTAAAPSLAYYCDPGNPESSWGKFWDVKSDDTQGLIAVGSLDQTTSYLFKEKTADRIEHLGGLSFQHDRGYLPVGIVAQGTLQKCTLSQEGRAVDVLIGLSDNGVYAFDTSKNPYEISKNIQFKFDRNNAFSWNRNHWHKSVAVYESARKWYWLFVPSHSSTGELDELWICDLETMAWWPCDPSAAASICMLTDSNGYPQVHVGGYDGHVRRFGSSILNYDGVAIDSYLTTGVIDFKKTVRVRQFIPYAKQKGNWNLDFDFRWGLSQAMTSTDSLLLTSGGGLYGTAVYGSATYGTGRPVYKNLSKLNYTGRHLQIKFGNNRVNENWNLLKMEMPCRIIGGRVGAYR